MQVSVRDNNVDQALRALKKKLQREDYSVNHPLDALSN
jgi:ribosomal protein S21